MKRLSLLSAMMVPLETPGDDEVMVRIPPIPGHPNGLLLPVDTLDWEGGNPVIVCDDA